jgi:subtilisin-like proprotein convertase family protein
MRRLGYFVALGAPALVAFVPGCSLGVTNPPAERIGAAPSAIGSESEPNGDADTATLISEDGVAIAYISSIGDDDVFSFRGTAGKRVYAATATAFSPSSSDSLLELIGPDGTTVLESDNDNGAFGTAASSLAGTLLTQTGAHYLRVRQAGGSSTIRPYHLHVKTQKGAPTGEIEPNDEADKAQLLPESGWVAGTIDKANDVDSYAVTLNAGDTVFASLDLDPERDGTEFDGALTLGPFGGGPLSVDDGGGLGPDSEALFATVKTAGVYTVAVASSGLGTGDYHLSVSVHPGARALCKTIASGDGPLEIPAMPGQTTSTIIVPESARIADIDVSVRIDHADPQHLDVSLQSPGGTRVGLFTDVGSAAFPGLDITLDDEAAFPVSSVSSLNGLVVQPEPAFRLEWFDGQDAAGAWTLRVDDDTAGKGGTLEGWSITICEPPPAPACSKDAAAMVLLAADFEADVAGFTHTGTNDTWEHGTPSAPGFSDCHSGTRCFKTNLSGDYAASSSQDLLSPPIDLTRVEGKIVASWAMKYQIENAQFDPAWIDVREVGGANPSRLWQWTGYTMASDMGGLEIQEIAGWGLHTADISGYAGKSVELVFHLQADEAGEHPGLAIDDVTVSACFMPLSSDGGGSGSSSGSGGAGGSAAGGDAGSGGAGAGAGSSHTARPEGGCGCDVPGRDRPAEPWAMVLPLLGLGLLRRRARP